MPLVAAANADISPLFGLLTLVLLLAVFISLVMAKLKQSLLVGYFLSGIIIANSGIPQWLGMDQGSDMIANFAELGIVLLMFTLGVEFSLRELRHLWRYAFIGGGLQMILTITLAGSITALFGMPWQECLVIGVVFALSSTAVSLKSFQDQGLSSNPAAKAALGIALFQDLLVIALFLILPTLFGKSTDHLFVEMGASLLKGVVFLLGAALLGRFGINPLLHAVARTRSRELFTLSIIGVSAGVAFAGGALHLSLALGAFAAGLVVSESIFSHRILTDIMPFRDLFLTIFFVSVGLMIDMHEVIEHWWVILLGTAVVFLVKSTIVFGISRLLRLPLRPALLAAVSLSSIGEFSLVLMQKTNQLRPLDPWLEQIILICTALGMALIPGSMIATSSFAIWLEKRGLFLSKRATPKILSLAESIKHMQDHAIICGYGPVGQQLHRALLDRGVPCLIIELNVDTAQALKKQSHPVLFADATHPEALMMANISKARMIAFTFPQVVATKISISIVLQENPQIAIFARAKFAQEAEELQHMGATVIHDEVESGRALMEHAMTAFDRS